MYLIIHWCFGEQKDEVTKTNQRQKIYTRYTHTNTIARKEREADRQMEQVEVEMDVNTEVNAAKHLTKQWKI